MMSDRSSHYLKRTAVIVVSLVLGTFGTSVIVSQVLPEREVIYTVPLVAPPSLSPEAAAPPPSPLEIREAIATASSGVFVGFDVASEQLPEVPWNEHGLARVAVTPEAIRFDAERDRYVADLDGGNVAILTFRPSLQQHLEAVVARYPDPMDAVAVIDPATGAVLALVDDHALDTLGPGGARRSSAYAASIFKVITGAALLGEDAASPETEICFSGGGSGFGLANLTHDPVADTICRNMVSAMATSANLYFARAADAHLTPAKLQEYAEQFGFNTRIPFELPLERSVASIPEDRLQFTRAAAGFYGTWLSPLHGALIQAAIANDGRMMVPTVVASIEGPDGEPIYRHRPTVWREVTTPEIAAQLWELQSTTCSTGTGRTDFGQRHGWPASIQVAGKTGTLSNRDPETGEMSDPHLTYSWFTGIAQRGDESVAVGALVVQPLSWHIRGTFLASEAVLASLL